jgi:hypothetical protein
MLLSQSESYFAILDGIMLKPRKLLHYNVLLSQFGSYFAILYGTVTVRKLLHNIRSYVQVRNLNSLKTTRISELRLHK